MIQKIAMGVAAALTAVVGYAVYKSEKERNMAWARIEDFPQEDTITIEEFLAMLPPEKEHFELEDLVHIVNPYNGEFMFFEDRELTRPGVYEVFAIVRDPATNLYRYKLSGLEGYFGHDWLLAAEAGPMVMAMPEADRQLREAYENQMEEYFVGKAVSPEVEQALYEKFVDDVFDRINAATSIEEKTALFRLLEESRMDREGNK